jgi:hypothetical protein
VATKDQSSRCGLGGEGLEGVAGEAHDAPLGEDVGADAFVDGDGGGVPGEDVPLEAAAALVDGDAGETREESFADALFAMLGRDVEVFETDAVVAAPGGVAGEVEGEADGGGEGGSLLGPVGDERSEARSGAEAVAEEVGFGGDDGVGFAFVEGEFVDEAEDGGDVGGCGGADVGLAHLSARSVAAGRYARAARIATAKCGGPSLRSG